MINMDEQYYWEEAVIQCQLTETLLNTAVFHAGEAVEFLDKATEIWNNEVKPRVKSETNIN